jgi:hypothetical protein
MALYCSNAFPSRACTRTYPFEPLQERGLELADSTAAGGGVEAMGLLEGVEAACTGGHPLVILG